MGKSGVVAVVGRPSTGKSSLLNSMCGQSVSIVSSVPQTTRNAIRGIVTDERGQLVFIDTPGFHRSERKFNLAMQGVVQDALEDVEAVLYVTDLSRAVGEEEDSVLELVKALQAPCVAALNKLDIAGNAVEERRRYVERALPEARTIPVSAATGVAVPDVLNALFALMPEGPAYYPEDIYTDQEPRFRIAEVIRERAIAHTEQEVPHALYVDIADSTVENTESGSTRIWVRAFIYVERENQKGIVVGHAGERIRAIRKEAEKVLREIFPYHISLDIRVKVHPKWRRKDALLKRLMH